MPSGCPDRQFVTYPAGNRSLPGSVSHSGAKPGIFYTRNGDVPSIVPKKISCYTIYNIEGGETVAMLSDPITILKGIGPTKAKQFAN